MISSRCIFIVLVVLIVMASCSIVPEIKTDVMKGMLSLFDHCSKSVRFQGNVSVEHHVRHDEEEEFEPVDFGGDGDGNCACKTMDGICFAIGEQQCYFIGGARIVECVSGGKWESAKKCRRNCDSRESGRVPFCKP